MVREVAATTSGKGRAGTGVTESAGKIRVSFQFQGARCRETMDLDWSISNRKAALKTLGIVKKEIKDGTFDYATHFPQSPKLKKGIVVRKTGAGGKCFGPALDAWLVTKSKLSGNARKCYRNAAGVWKEIFGEDTLMTAMTAEHVETEIAMHPFASAKLMNNYLTVLRGACALVAKGDKSWPNPMLGVENGKVQTPTPDPLSRTEMHKVLGYMFKNFDVRVHAWYVWEFETGMRPEEAIALQWGDVDWARKTAHVERARSLGELGPVKTFEVRDVDLTPAALDALRVMSAHTQTKIDLESEIFQNPNTLRPWHDNRSQHDHYWTPALAACKVRKRRSYNTRHTYATLRLMVGAVPAYISRQMGHRSALMLFKTYAKWIDADKSERDRVQQLLAAQDAVAGLAQKHLTPA